MTELEWQLRKENAKLKMVLAQVQSQMLQDQFNAAEADDKKLCATWDEYQQQAQAREELTKV